MANEYLKPMLDVGSPRVLNCNVITRRILAKDPNAKVFFQCKPLNNVVLIKDTDPFSRGTGIGTKIYCPFNENDIYEGGRTVFVHNKHVDEALIENFGTGALPRPQLDSDMRILRILDRLPSLDPFLLKDVFINEKIDMNPDYFEVSKELWNEIELYILQNFETLAKAAFPDALSSDEVARKLIEKIWEGRDLEALRPLILAFRLPAGKEMETFAAWKGVIFYGFEYSRTLSPYQDLCSWLLQVKIPVAAGTPKERQEIKNMGDKALNSLQQEWQSAEKVLKEYETAYEAMFKYRTGSAPFLNFMQNSSKAYWTLGNALGRVGHSIYCWDAIANRYPERNMPWEQTLELIQLIIKICASEKKPATEASWV